jgi:hypothetical protein
MSREATIQRIDRLEVSLGKVAANDTRNYGELESPVVTAVENLRNIKRTLTQHRIAVAGFFASGKSTFLNKIIGFPILPVGNGATTTFAIEITSHRAKDFVVTVHYKPRSHLKTDLQYLATHYMEQTQELEEGGEGNNDSDAKFELLVDQLQHVFDFEENGLVGPPNPFATNPSLIAKLPANDGDHPLIELIGDKPTVISRRFATHADASKELTRHLRVPYVIDHVCVSGPFENLPEAVVLVDTPGLGDSNAANPMRTLEYMDRVDEVWFVTTQRQRLNALAEKQFLTQVPKLVGKPVHLVMTMSDQIDREDESAERDHLRSVLRDYRAENVAVLLKLRKNTNKHTKAMALIPEDQRAIVEASVRDLLIDFVNCPPGGAATGIDHWVSRLRLAGKPLAELSNTAARDLEAKVAYLYDLATRRYDEVRVTADQITAWETHSLHLIETVFPDHNVFTNFYATVAWTGQWGSMHGMTKRAAMKPSRAGEYWSEARGYVNFNWNIASVWADRMTPVMQNLANLEAGLAAMPDPVNDHRRRLALFLQDLRQQYLQSGSTAAIQHYLVRCGVYSRLDRKDPPDELEVKRTVEYLLDQVREGLRNLRWQVEWAAAALRRQYVNNAIAPADNHAGIQEAVRAALQEADSPAAEQQPGPLVITGPEEEEWWNTIWRDICGCITTLSVITDGVAKVTITTNQPIP